MENPITYVFSVLGDAINGLFQVIVDFLNLLADIVPNPDPFPAMIEAMPEGSLYDFGFAAYWLDVFIGIDFMRDGLTVFFGMLIASLVFTMALQIVKLLKP